MASLRLVARIFCALLLVFCAACANLGGSHGGSSPAAQAQVQPPAPAAQTVVYPPNDGFLDAPKIETLQPGYRFSRYGGYFDASGAFRDKGNFVAPENVPFEQRALPPQAKTRPFSVYEVVQPIEGVRSGPAAPWFGQPGLGLQHELPLTIQDYLDQGKIRLVSRVVPAK